jgi:hypothetical protein
MSDCNCNCGCAEVPSPYSEPSAYIADIVKGEVEIENGATQVLVAVTPPATTYWVHVSIEPPTVSDDLFFGNVPQNSQTGTGFVVKLSGTIPKTGYKLFYTLYY